MPDYNLPIILSHKGNQLPPATAASYKNHMAIIMAVENINRKLKKVEILFTIDERDNKYARKLVERAKNVSGIYFVGKLSRNEIFKYYKEYFCKNLFSAYIPRFNPPLYIKLINKIYFPEFSKLSHNL